MKFPKEWLRDNVAWGPGGGVVLIYNKTVDTTRWSTVHEAVFQFEGVYYKTSYRNAATECQEEQPYEYDDDVVEVEVVKPYYTISINYLTMAEVMECAVKLLPVDDGPSPMLARLHTIEKQ